jgi:esterase/lipase superfamily enzyme/GNAT superfamily N-acetyltransferase
MQRLMKYLYFEERPLEQQTPGKRQRNAIGQLAAGVSNKSEIYVASQYPWWQTRALEGRSAADESEGVWLINLNRVWRHVGDPGGAMCPVNSRPPEWPANVHETAQRYRLHHYVRVWDSSQCREILSHGTNVTVALEVTEEWYDPAGGIIEVAHESPVLGSHCVAITKFDFENGKFVFPNSWGKDWGESGWGALSADVFDRFVIEAFCLEGLSIEQPIEAKSGLLCLLWKSECDGQEVHGREIVNASTGERLAWTFLVRRGNHLDIEEFFVWPAHRRKGYASKLVELIHEFARESGLAIRAWIPFADAAAENRPALRRLMDSLGLELTTSPRRAAAFLAIANQLAEYLAEPRIPERPASMHKRLDPAIGARLYSVWFGTNRKPVDLDNANRGFSNARDDRVHYGRCEVAIPKSHRFGSIGSSWWPRWRRCTDDRLQIVTQRNCTEVEFWQDLSEHMIQCGHEERHGLVFLHGFNVDFEEAAIRAAQIGFDLKVPGLTAFFSWPSCGTLTGYPVDEATIEASGNHIAEFLRDFVARSGAQRVHLVAHSMGNRGLIQALTRLVTKFSESGVSFGQIILAAPDIDSDLFSQLAEVFPRVGHRTTLYASPADHAVGMSQWLHAYPRAGLIPPVTIVPGVDTVEVPCFNILDLGHAYFAEAGALLHDIFDLIRRNAPPADRQRLEASKSESGATYWVMTN